jgi:retron-type reverse transcriptase
MKTREGIAITVTIPVVFQKNHQIDHPSRNGKSTLVTFPWERYLFWRFILIKSGTYKLVYDFENLYQSANIAAREKRYEKSVLTFFNNLEENLIQLQNELIWKEYKLGKFFYFERYEPKRREIGALPFRDRIVQIALCNIIEPEFEQRFIYDSYACRVNKGTLAAANRISYFLGKRDAIKYLKCDIHKFFASINIDLLQSLIREWYIEDEDILWLINKILLHEYDDDGIHGGIKIGNRFSQLAANAVLHELDFKLKVQERIPYYVRYMDDFIILSDSKSKLKQYLEISENFLENTLLLHLNGKTKIDNCRNGIDFVGYRIFPHNKIIKKQSMNRTRNVFNGWKNGKITNEKYLASIGSRCGHAKGTSSYKFYMNILLKSLQVALDQERKKSHS